MHLVFLNRSYWPDSEATGQLLTELSEDLVKIGHQVTVITGQPNSVSLAEGELYQNAGRQVRRGVEIIRCHHFRLFKGHTLGRLVNLLSFTIAAAYQLRRQPRPDLIVCETDPFLLPWIGARYSRRTKVPMLAYLQDIYPDVAVAIGKIQDGLLVRIVRRRLKHAYLTAKKVVVLSDEMAQRIVSWGIPASHVNVVPNWVDTERIVPVHPTENRFRQDLLQRLGLDSSGVIFMHSGNMGLTQPLDAVVRATIEPAFPAHAGVAIIGGGSRQHELEKLAQQLGAHRVVFLPYQPKSALSETLSAADFHLVASDARVAGCLAPSKLYGILAVNRPTLWLGGSLPLTKAQQIQAGITVLSEVRPSRVAEQMNVLVEKAHTAVTDRRSENGITLGTSDSIRGLACRHFSRSVVIRQLDELFERTVSQGDQ